MCKTSQMIKHLHYLMLQSSDSIIQWIKTIKYDNTIITFYKFSNVGQFRIFYAN